MDSKALFQLSYGVHILSSSFGGKDAGCVVNTLAQVTNSPARLCVAVNKENFTHDVIARSEKFAAMVLLEGASMELIRAFGFQSSRDADKFAGFHTLRDEGGLPYIAKEVGARFHCVVVGRLDAGTHTVFLGEIMESEVLSTDPVMTYAYYHHVKQGKTPPKASSYQPPEQEKQAGWECTVCGYVYNGEELPSGYICPLCKAPASAFRRI